MKISEAVELVYRGRSNMIKAAKAADVDVDTLKRLLLEKCRSSKNFEPLQLEMILDTR